MIGELAIVSKQPRVKFYQAINLTAHHIGFYDADGGIAICDPGCHSDLLKCIDPNIMVIVANYADIKAFSIPQENAVIADSFSTGRLGIRVSRLIRPYDNAIVTFIPPTVRTIFTPVSERSAFDEVYHV